MAKGLGGSDRSFQKLPRIVEGKPKSLPLVSQNFHLVEAPALDPSPSLDKSNTCLPFPSCQAPEDRPFEIRLLYLAQVGLQLDSNPPASAWYYVCVPQQLPNGDGLYTRGKLAPAASGQRVSVPAGYPLIHQIHPQLLRPGATVPIPCLLRLADGTINTVCARRVSC